MTRIGEQPGADMFGDREPSNRIEVRLNELQAESDSIGMEVWRRIITGEAPQTEDDARHEALRREAEAILGDDVGYDIPTSFLARYFYDLTQEHMTEAQLNFPLDCMFFAAHIDGKLLEVQSVPVRHPSPNRDGEVGMRLCARIEATRVIGRRVSEDNAMIVHVPVGELYLGDVSTDLVESEALQPNLPQQY